MTNFRGLPFNEDMAQSWNCSYISNSKNYRFIKIYLNPFSSNATSTIVNLGTELLINYVESNPNPIQAARLVNEVRTVIKNNFDLLTAEKA